MKRLGAFGAALLVASVLAGTTSGGRQVVSANGQVVPVGTRYRGVCLLQGGQISGRIAYWELAGVIPAFRRRGPGVVLRIRPGCGSIRDFRIAKTAFPACRSSDGSTVTMFGAQKL